MIMEYLTRSLIYYVQQSQFRYHPMCKSMKLVNLWFADDLMIFCKGHLPSIQLTVEAFTHFSNASRNDKQAKRPRIYSWDAYKKRGRGASTN